MSNQIDINVEEIEHIPYVGFNFEFLRLKFTGKDSNIKLINSFRRACAENIPKYAFARELINITKNTTTAFNNDYMTLRLSQLPVFNVKDHDVDPQLSYFHERYWQHVNYLDRDRLVADEEKNIEIQINVHNNTDTIKNIDTSDPGFKVYIDNEKVNMYNSEWPIQIIQLRPNDSFSCSMKAVLGLGERNTIWAACSNAWHYYEDDDPTKDLIVALRPSGSIKGHDIATRACEYLNLKLAIIKKEVLRQLDKSNIKGGMFELEFKNEDSTLAELINYELQSHKNILFSGVTKPDHLLRSMVIRLEFKNNIKETDVKKSIEESFNIASDKVLFLKIKLEEISKSSNKVYKSTSLDPDKTTPSKNIKKTKK
jgi:DNA-directed RNA polymerase subunit L